MILNESVNVNVVQLLTNMFPILSTQTRILSQNVYGLLLRVKRQDDVGISTLKYQGETFVDATDKANVFADYFSSVFTSEDVTHIPTLTTDPTPSTPPIHIHVEGVYDLLQNIQQHEASGPDNLPARFLEEVAFKISPILTLIFRASLDQGMLPSIWKTAEVVPIFKKGNKSDPCNYRPVSLTCICCKILEHIPYGSKFS